MSEETVVWIADDGATIEKVLGACSACLEEMYPAPVSSEAWLSSKAAPARLAVVVEQVPSVCDAVLARCEALGVCAIVILQESRPSKRLSELLAAYPKTYVLLLDDDGHWKHLLALISREVISRAEAVTRARRAEASAQAGISQVVLGRYVMDSMHSFNNALTAVVGNAELLMLDPLTLPEHMREQIDAVHSNALRLHEMMQRFSSLQTEMQFKRKDSLPEAKGLAQAYHSGS